MKHLATGTAAARQLPFVREHRHHSISSPQQFSRIVKLTRNIGKNFAYSRHNLSQLFDINNQNFGSDNSSTTVENVAQGS